MVNETFAKKYLSNQPLGMRISQGMNKSGQQRWIDIVGEVADSRDWARAMDPMPEFFIPRRQSKDLLEPILMVRTSGDPAAMQGAIKRQVAAMDKNAPVTEVLTMNQIVSKESAQSRFQTILLGSFGFLGFMLAMVGIYGVISYNVTQRTREIGVRMALGARPGNVVRMVIREGMVLALIGIILGVGGALALGRFVKSLLFEIKPSDPATFVAVAVALALVALVACYLPARRAVRVDPMVALRYE